MIRSPSTYRACFFFANMHRQWCPHWCPQPKPKQSEADFLLKGISQGGKTNRFMCYDEDCRLWRSVSKLQFLWRVHYPGHCIAPIELNWIMLFFFTFYETWGGWNHFFPPTFVPWETSHPSTPPFRHSSASKCRLGIRTRELRVYPHDTFWRSPSQAAPPQATSTQGLHSFNMTQL